MRKSTSPRPTARRGPISRLNLRLPKAWSTDSQDYTPGGPLSQRLRRHLPAVLVTHLSTVAVVFSLAIITILASGAPAMAFPATLAAGWLLTNGAPIGVGGTVLGVPPSLLVMAFITWQAMRIRASVRERVAISDVRTLVICAVLVPTALTGIALAMVADASTVLPVAVEHPWLCVGKTIVVALLAVFLGMGSKLWRALLRFYNLPRWLLDSGHMACLFLAALWIAGGAATLISLLVHTPAVGSAFATTTSTAGKAGLTLISLLYLPTIALGAGAVMMGGEAHIGPALISIFGVSQAQLPPVPVLAALPTGAAPGITGFLVLVIPAVISVAVFRRHLGGRTIASPYLTVAATSAIACIIMLAATWVLSGPLGLYGWTGITASAAGLATLAWVLVPGVLYLAVSGWTARSGVPAWLPFGRGDDGTDGFDDEDDASAADNSNTADSTYSSEQFNEGWNGENAGTDHANATGRTAPQSRTQQRAESGIDNTTEAEDPTDDAHQPEDQSENSVAHPADATERKGINDGDGFSDAGTSPTATTSEDHNEQPENAEGKGAQAADISNTQAHDISTTEIVDDPEKTDDNSSTPTPGTPVKPKSAGDTPNTD